MLSFAKYFCILSICNLLLLHGITSAPTESDESVLEDKQYHGCHGSNCGGGGGSHNCPSGQHWNGFYCVPSGSGHGK